MAELQATQAGLGRPVGLLHPFPVDGDVYRAQLDAAAAGRLPARIVALEFPGFGRTPLPEPAPAILRVEDLAEAVERFLDDRGLERPIVGGVAIGGYVAVEVARRDPERLGGIVLMGCKAAPDAPANRPMREAVAARALADGSGAVADDLAGAALGPHAMPEHRARMHAMISRADPRAIAALVMGLHVRPDPAPSLAALELPVLLIAGDADPFTKVADARRASDVIRDSMYVELPGVGHIAPLEAPDAVSDAIAAFLGRVP
jgi:pimeloyl-ACP methyl ester carboxylesterase